MRLFHLLAAALVSNLSAKHLDGASYDFPKEGFLDGAVLTIQVNHRGDGTEEEPVGVNFFDLKSAEVDEEDDRDHLKFDRSWESKGAGEGGHGWSVTHNTYENGRWLDEPVWADRDQPLDYRPLSKGWWKIDIVKIDKYHLNVFFNGFWSGIRKFQRSLDNAKSVFVTSKFVDTNSDKSTIFWHKAPNNNIKPPISLEQTEKYLTSEHPPEKETLFKFDKFPVGKAVEIVAVLRSSTPVTGKAEDNKRKPALIFKSPEHKDYIWRIVQFWGGTGSADANVWEPTHNTNEMHLATSEELPMLNQYRKGWATTLCTDYFTKPNGDLVHLRVERTDEHTIKTTLIDKDKFCQVEIPDDRLELLDKPFDIVNSDGAFIVHIETDKIKEKHPIASGWASNAAPSLISALLPALAALCLMILALE